MSIQTLYTAATGMESLQTKLDVIANNLANVNTTGFKKGRANFEDLFYRHYKYPGTADQQNNLTATGTSIGLGSRVQSVQTSQQQGAFQQPRGPAQAGRQPLCRNKLIREPSAEQPQHQRRWPGSPGSSRSLQRRAGPGTDRFDHHPEVVRTEFPGDPGRGPDFATDFE